MLVKKLTLSVCSLLGLKERLRVQGPWNFEVITSYFDSTVNAKKEKPNGLQQLGESSRVDDDGEALEVEWCCVCLLRLNEEEEKQDNSAEMRALACGHEFHKACIDKWFDEYRQTCPVCRFSMEEDVKTQKREEVTDDMVIWFSSFHIGGYI